MRKLAIVGTHPRTRDLAPFDDPNYEIWVFNEAPQQAWCKRWDVDFQMHKPEVYTSRNNFVRTDHWDWLQAEHGLDRIIYMQEMDYRVPNCEKFPLDAIKAAVPGASFGWFKSTPAYAIALALLLGYKQISLYGLDMASNTEYGYQLPNFQFWVGVALGMGVQVGNHSNEQYFTGALYAYEGEVQIDRAYFADRAKTLEVEYKKAKWQAEKTADRLRAAIDDGKYDRVRELVGEHQEAMTQAGELSGAMDVALKYAARDDLIPRQEFERRAAEGQRDAEDKRREMWIASGEVQYVWNAWKTHGVPEAKRQLLQFIQKQVLLAQEAGIRTGVMRENYSYMEKIDELITAAGGQRTLAALGVA